MASKTEDNIRRIAEIEAVQGNAGIGLTIGDIDAILHLHRADAWNASGEIANILDPNSEWTHSSASGRTAAIRDAVRAHDAKYATD